MRLINKLDSNTIKKIAAGQVIQNSASVVKELVENSIDAQAKNIVVEIQNGGLASIKVTDDGKGMSNEDILLSYLPHTTSKIKTYIDLSNVSSMGFRGEALASICAVASVRIRSKNNQESAGREITINKDTIVDDDYVGMPTGTLVEVRDLFCEIPARRNHLGSASKEGKAILDVLINYVLGYPEIGFKFFRDGSLVFSVRKESSEDYPKERLDLVLGRNKSDWVYPFKYENEDKAIFKGFISHQKISSTDKSSQYVFINRRPVKLDILGKKIKQVYGNLLEETKYPPFIIFIQVPSDKVDVNIHPAKEDVLVASQEKLIDTFGDFLEHFIAEYDFSYKSSYDKGIYEIPVFKDNMFLSLRENTEKWAPQQLNDNVIQVDKTFIVTTCPDGLLILDQHAAHESILYEQYQDAYNKGLSGGECHDLKDPLILNFGLPEYENLGGNLDSLNKIGFKIEEFGELSIRVSAVPVLFKDYDISDLLIQITNEMVNNKVSLDTRTKTILSYLACRGAVKSGDILSEEAMKNIISKLTESSSYYTCPHGRPAKMILKTKDISRMFKR